MLYPKFYPSIILTGTRFLGRNLQSSNEIEIYRALNPGDYAKEGRYKSVPCPFGSCIIQPLIDNGEYINIDKVLEFFLVKKEEILRIGADLSNVSFCVTVKYSEENFGFELKKSTISLLAQFPDDIGFDFYTSNDID